MIETIGIIVVLAVITGIALAVAWCNNCYHAN